METHHVKHPFWRIWLSNVLPEFRADMRRITKEDRHLHVAPFKVRAVAPYVFHVKQSQANNSGR